MMPRFHSQSSGSHQPWLYISITRETFKERNGLIGVLWTKCWCLLKIYMLKPNPLSHVIILEGGPGEVH